MTHVLTNTFSSFHAFWFIWRAVLITRACYLRKKNYVTYTWIVLATATAMECTNQINCFSCHCLHSVNTTTYIATIPIFSNAVAVRIGCRTHSIVRINDRKWKEWHFNLIQVLDIRKWVTSRHPKDVCSTVWDFQNEQIFI